MNITSSNLIRFSGLALVPAGIVFAGIFALHTWEVVDRHHVYASDVLVLVASAGLSVWAGRLVKKDIGKGVP